MKIIRKVILWVLVALIFYPFIHFVKQSLKPEDVHAVGAFLGVVGAIYGVLVAFTIFVVWDQFNAVEKATIREAGIVDDLYRLSRYFGDDFFDQKRKLAQHLKEYLLAGIQEWKNLSCGRESETAAAALTSLERDLREFHKSNESNKIIYQNLINTLEKFYEARDERVAIAKHRMPRTLLNLLVMLSVVLVLGFCSLPVRSVGLGTFVVMSTVGILVAILEVIKDMDNPFSGVWNVDPKPFAEQARRIY